MKKRKRQPGECFRLSNISASEVKQICLPLSKQKLQNVWDKCHLKNDKDSSFFVFFALFSNALHLLLHLLSLHWFHPVFRRFQSRTHDAISKSVAQSVDRSIGWSNFQTLYWSIRWSGGPSRWSLQWSILWSMTLLKFLRETVLLPLPTRMRLMPSNMTWCKDAINLSFTKEKLKCLIICFHMVAWVC